MERSCIGSAASASFRQKIPSQADPFRAVCLLTAGVLAAFASSRGLAADGPAGSGSLDSVEAHLAAGEFAPALDLAERAADPAERSRLLGRVAHAQRDWGDPAAAWRTARRAPDGGLRNTILAQLRQPLFEGVGGDLTNDRANGPQANSATAAGGAQADFTQLVDLITSTIAPESWDAVGGAGSVSPYINGVFVDPEAALRRGLVEEHGSALPGGAALTRLRQADLSDEARLGTELRVLSLRALERAVRERARAGLPPTASMQHLGGITRLRFVALDPVARDVLIGGPAEGWEYLSDGEPVGIVSRRPPLRLDDLIVLFRFFAEPEQSTFGCSINPRPDNLKSVVAFVDESNSRGALRPSAVKRWVEQLHEKLGAQDVVVQGLPRDTRAARVMVVANYRMKLVGLGKLDGGPNVPDCFKLWRKSGQAEGKGAQGMGGAIEALRWWLTMRYDAIAHDPSRTAYELRGASVLVQSENQFVTERGERIATGAAEPVNRQFAENFTKHYDELARRDPVFADLANLFDLGLLAVLWRSERLGERIDWPGTPFGRDLGYSPVPETPITEVDSVVAHRVFDRRDIVVQVAGGVQAPLGDIPRQANLRREDEALTNLRSRVSPPPETSRWWWSGR